MNAGTLAGVCDTHIHVYDARYPSSAAAVLHPPDASLAEYLSLQRVLSVDRVVLVQPTTYGLDNRCQEAAVLELGDRARLVAVVDDTTPVDELERLHGVGCRGARFHMLPGGAVGWDALPTVARQIERLGWHVQIQLDGRTLPSHIDMLRSLPTPVVIDHVGRYMPPVATDDESFRALLELIDDGRCWVKLSAPYESTHDGAPEYPDVATLAHELVRRAPERMLWASNWPHPGQAEPLAAAELLALREQWLPTDELRRRVLVDNPALVYGFPPFDPSPDPSPDPARN